METFESSSLTQNENEQAYQTTRLCFVYFNFLSSCNVFRKRDKKNVTGWRCNAMLTNRQLLYRSAFIRLRATQPKNCGLFPGKSNKFSSSKLPDRLWPNLPYLTGTEVSFPTKWQAHEANHSSPSSSGVKNQWYYHQSPVCLPVVHMDIHTFIFTLSLVDDE